MMSQDPELGHVLLIGCLLIITAQVGMNLTDFVIQRQSTATAQAMLDQLDTADLWTPEDRAEPLYVETRRLLLAFVGPRAQTDPRVHLDLCRHARGTLKRQSWALGDLDVRISDPGLASYLRYVLGYLEDLPRLRLRMRLISLTGGLVLTGALILMVLP